MARLTLNAHLNVCLALLRFLLWYIKAHFDIFVFGSKITCRCSLFLYLILQCLVELDFLSLSTENLHINELKILKY